MQEFAIILSSIAGVATAAAIRKTPRNKKQLLSIGASAHIKGQISSLKIEKDILTKTISRLYQSDSDLTKIQRDKLLIKYQHQLGIVLAKIEKLEDASKHPDLGPVGDGLITLMDQKLSKLDDRLYELSSKISSSKVSVPEIKKDTPDKIQKPTEMQKSIIKETETSEPITEEKPKKSPFIFEIPKPKKTEPVVIPPSSSRQAFEITTLTSISKKDLKFPEFEKKFTPKEEIVQQVVVPKQKTQNKISEEHKTTPSQTKIEFDVKPDITKEVEKITKFKALPIPKDEKPKAVVTLDDDFDDDSDDIDKIKGEILDVLSKLDQAEVE